MDRDSSIGTQEENHELELDSQSVQAVHELQNKNAALQSAFSEEQQHKNAVVNQRIGRRQILTMFEKISNVTNLVDLQKIKESKEYKGLQVSIDGETRNITTWADYCRVVEGRSVESIDLDLQNLNAFGEELFESMRQVGIGPGKMRTLRKLPDDDIALIQQARECDDKDQIAELVDSLVSKHAREKQQLAQDKEQLTKERDDAQADKAAVDQVLADKSSKIDELEKQVSRKRLERLPPDEESQHLREEANSLLFDAETSIRQLAQPLEQVVSHATEHGIDIGHWLRGQLDQLSEATEYLREQLGMVSWQPSTDPDLDGEQWDGQVVDAERTVQ
ncbi:hypothetical protein [Marinobacterium stanieri]|uniref:Uncharacterized protein n=1 Tax=Marinobacterium stanieri TaxID=49186 RepID=A0A1N6RNL9_9GAMM|nr:hypothetical protein [Marinobacterium stanieri]SIQ30322.1 hypothetical protein SAMN05421647_103431 [Marinobacterium stanieri]